MKKNFLFLLALLCTTAQVGWAQGELDTVYVSKKDHPDAAYFLPEPPDTNSVAFIDDMIQWEWGKSQRNTPRGEQASRETPWLPEIMRTVMAEVLQIDTISDEKTPALSRLLVKSYHTGNQSTVAPKETYSRKRPIVRMNEDTWGKYDSDFLRTNGSYPSGHTAFGWATALAFAEMWPELQDTILRRGVQFGENRIITGAHWQSDVNAGYLCAAASMAKAHTNPDFLKDVLAARAEYAKLKGLPAGYDPVSKADVPHGEDFLNMPVDTASYRYAADVLQFWDAKRLRDTERGHQAEEEADYSVEMMQKVFGEAMGINISPVSTPAICELIELVLNKASETADRLKPIRFRKRPFVQLGEHTTVPEDEEKEKGKSSFPSGHTNLGWSMALVMAEVAPEQQNEILRRGYQYGYNRLIAGYHWASDIEASRLLASALVARLHADLPFLQLVYRARYEFLINATGITTVLDDQEPASSPAYLLNGIPATPDSHGIIIQNGQKFLVK